MRGTYFFRDIRRIVFVYRFVIDLRRNKNLSLNEKCYNSFSFDYVSIFADSVGVGRI